MKDALLATVLDETAAVEAFEALLAYERTALTAAKPLAALPLIIEQKTELTARLAALEKARDGHLGALGLQPGFVGMQQAVAGDEELGGPWRQLLAVVRRAQRGNNTNGVLIRTRMEFNRRTLAVLRVAPLKAGFYGPDGRIAGY